MIKCFSSALAIACFACLLSSCYFNSAGHIFDNASYRAVNDMADLKPGDHVYSDGSNYYVELPRYRFGKKVRTQMSVFGKANFAARTPIKGETDMVQIPADYAAYLTGRSGSLPQSITLAGAGDAEKVKSSGLTTQTVVKTATLGDQGLRYFNHQSPNSAWWYTLGAFDWLCVDLPMTCLENSLMICGGFLFVGGDDGSEQAPTFDLTEGFQTQDITRDVYKRVYYYY